MNKDLIIKYITETYSPEAIIVYGSYANGREARIKADQHNEQQILKPHRTDLGMER